MIPVLLTEHLVVILANFSIYSYSAFQQRIEYWITNFGYGLMPITDENEDPSLYHNCVSYQLLTLTI